MKKSIVKFSLHRTALTAAVVMAISSLIFLIPMSLMMLGMPATDENGNPLNPGMPIGLLLLMPVIYLVMGYLMTALGAWIYNQVAKYTGGIEFELSSGSSDGLPGASDGF